MSEETALIPFDFEEHKVRGMRDEHGDPWIAATDACEALGISNVSDAVSRLPDDEKAAIVTTDTAGRPNKLLFVNEAGLYRLIFTSRKAEAERFKKRGILRSSANDPPHRSVHRQVPDSP